MRVSCELPSAHSGPLPPLAPGLSSVNRGLTPKKKHEIEAILSDLIHSDSAPRFIVDIGGGAGHLSRHLALRLGSVIYSIDPDPNLQESGQTELKKAPWHCSISDQVRFICGRFPENWESLPEGARAASDLLTVGLHTCGGLALHHLRLAAEGHAVLNFGCCFEKLSLQTETHLSQLARANPADLTEEALFLANRGGVERTFEDFEFQQRVTQYRFALHLLLQREGDTKPPLSVGTAREAIYRDTFAVYVRDRAHSPLSDSAINDFFRSQKLQLERLRFASWIRNLCARPLEVLVLTDRALWLEALTKAEPGAVQLRTFFDAQLSPRNLGLSYLGHGGSRRG